jgi:hypothetical protein
MPFPDLFGHCHALGAAEVKELPHPGGLPPAACFAAFPAMKMQEMF